MRLRKELSWTCLLFGTVVRSQQFTNQQIAYDTSLLGESCNATVATLVDECGPLKDTFAMGTNSMGRRLIPICTASMTPCLEKLQQVKKQIKLACTLKTDVFAADENGAMLREERAALLGVTRIADRTVPATFWVDGLAAVVKTSCTEASYPDAPGTEPDCAKYKYYYDPKVARKFMGKNFQTELRSINSCWQVLVQEDITPELLLELNPSLDSGLARCELKPGLRYCMRKRIPILSTLFRWGWNIYSFVTFCRGVLRVFGWA